MKIMIIGSEGMLGHDLVDVLSAENEVCTTTIDTLDITDIEKTIKTVKENNPDVLVHAAAFTDVDGSESNPDLAYKVNAIGTRNVAVACKEAEVQWYTYARIMYLTEPITPHTMNMIKPNHWVFMEKLNMLVKFILEIFLTNFT